MGVKTADIDVDILRETDDAILVTDGSVEVWLPKSQIVYEGEAGDRNVEIILPEWMAEKKGLI